MFYNLAVGMNPSRRERWPVEPGTRHVWIMGRYRYELPIQGYIIDRKKRGAKWVALVVYMTKVDEEHAVVQRWVPMSKLRPVFSRPEESKIDPY